MPDNLKLAEAALEKWRKNLTAEKPDDVKMRPEDCPFCLHYFDNEECEGCPIAEHTGQFGCGSTPYDDAWDAVEKWRGKIPGAEAHARRAIQTEIDFLEMIRDEVKAEQETVNV